VRKRYELKRKKQAAFARALDQGEPHDCAGKTDPTELGRRGVVTRFRRTETADSIVASLGMIKRGYPDAIEYTAIAAGMRGMVMLMGLGTSAISLWGAYAAAGHFFSDDGFRALDFFSIAVSIIFGSVAIYWAIKAVRLELFRPEDEPTIFDRKNRKVYRIYRETYAGWRGLLAPWPLKSAEHDWDLIDAEHHAAVITTGSTVSRMHGLIFLVRKSATDPTPVDSFAIGNGMQLGEITVPAVWEHIRRFMEEDGPHLPPNEVLQPQRQPTTFWQCMGAPFPSLRQLRSWWPNELPLMLMGLLTAPVIVPIMVLLGVLTWFAYRTSIPVAWSPAVLEAIGDGADGPANCSGERT
jgi:hypothetical protein